MAAAALPMLGKIGGAVGGTLLGGLFGKKSVDASLQKTPEEHAAYGAQTAAGTQLSQQGGSLFRQGEAPTGQALGYFSKLAGGNRGVMAGALAPEVAGINDAYGGTQQTLRRFLRGPAKDVQLGELERNRAGAVSGLFRDARPRAASALFGMGSQLQGMGNQATAQGGSIFGQQVAQGQSNRFGVADQERQAGADFGGLMFNIIRMFSQQQSKGGD